MRIRLTPERLRELSLAATILLAVLLFGSFVDNYYSPRTFNRIASSVMIIMVVAVGQTVVILSRNIDLSVGAIVGSVAYATGMLVASLPDLHPLLAAAFAIGMGAALGLFNAVWIVGFGVPSIIVTLATMAVFRGVLIQLSGARSVTGSSLPAWIAELPQTTVLSLGGLEIRAMVAVAIVAVVLFQVLTSAFRAGRTFYLVGSNPDAARYAGVPAGRVVLVAFVLSGALAGLAGFMTLARFGNIAVEAGIGLELSVIAAVVVGGVSIFGGSGTVAGAALGALLIGTLEQSLFRLQISQFWLDALLGLLILVAISGDSVMARRLIGLWPRGGGDKKGERQA